MSTSDVQSVMDVLASKASLFKFIQADDEHNVEVWQLIKDSNYKQMFGSLNHDRISTLCLSEEKIEHLCEDLKMHHYWSIFLFKKSKRGKVQYCVARVKRLSDGHLHREDDRLPKEHNFFGSRGHQLVVPRLS